VFAAFRTFFGALLNVGGNDLALVDVENNLENMVVVGCSCKICSLLIENNVEVPGVVPFSLNRYLVGALALVLFFHK
jgi:hypothetical protein